MLGLALLSLLAATPPAPTRWVTDEAGLLTPSTRLALDRRLEELERSTGHQVLVWIGKTTAGEPIELFAERAFRAWKPGRAKLDDGVVLFVFAEDRSLRLEVGYGLEPILTDAQSSRIINERIAPLLKAGDADGALTSGVEALITTLGGAPAPSAPAPRTLTTPEWVALGAAIIGFLVLLIIRPDLALRLITLMLFLRRGGRGGGTGFSGRGGRSGGGGASGRW
ncbi:MAG: TPM domain-containing protein [Archangium sp.]|nr:TPM domain-containing protein [Archangium sp.]